MTCAVISTKIDSVNNFAKYITAIVTERDFKSERLFCMCSVATNLVTSLEIQPTRSATMLCHFGQTRNGWVATIFLLLSSTAESSARSGCVIVPERFDQNEEPANRIDERTRRKPNFVPNRGFNRCNMLTHVNKNFIHLFHVFYLINSTYIWCTF